MSLDALVTVCELGPLGVRCGTEWSPIRGRRSTTVVALLAANRDRLRTADELVEAAWPEPDRPATARQSLANMVSRLRRSHGASFIELSGNGYRLGSTVESERARFLELLDEAASGLAQSPTEGLSHADRALALWRGSPWADIEIDEIRIDQSRLLQAEYRHRAIRAECLALIGNAHEAIVVFGGLAADNPLDEAAWNGWAQALGATHRRVEALRVLDNARATLAASGVLPGPPLLTTEHRLLEEQRDEEPATVASPRPTTRDLPAALAERPPVLVGREPCLDALARAWRTSATAGHVHVIVGQAGIGKTTVVVEFAHRVAEEGGNVLHGASDDVLNVPFQPYVAALNGWTEQSGHEFEDVALRGVGASSNSTEAITLFRVVAAFAGAVAAIADSGRTLIVLEDFHWANPETITLTRALARRLPRGVLLVATTRPTDSGNAEPVEALLEDSRRLSSMTQSVLEELSVSDAGRLVAALAPGQRFEPSLVATVAGGSPLLLAELASASLSSPTQDPGWSIAQLQLGALGGEQRRVLEFAAVLGEGFWVEDLAEVAAWKLADIVELLDQAEQRRLVTFTRDNTWRFRHAIVRDVVLSHLTPRSRARRHLRVGESLAAKRRPNAAEVAQHYVMAVGCGGRRPALEWLRRAASEATHAGAHEQAADHWERLIEFDTDAEPEDLVASHMAHGNALVRAGYWERSHQPFETAADLALNSGDIAAHADAAIAWVQAPENHSAASRFPDFVLGTAEMLDDLDESRSARLAACLAIDAMDNNRIDQALALSQRASAQAQGLGEVETVAFVERARMRIWWDPNQIAARYQAALDLAGLGRLHGSTDVLGYGLRWQVIHGIESGRLIASRTVCQELIQHGNRRGEPFHVWFGWSRLAVIQLALGNVGASLESLEHAADLADILETTYVRSAQDGVRLGLELQLGCLDSDATSLTGLALLGTLSALVQGRLDDVRDEVSAVEPSTIPSFERTFGDMPGRLFWGPMALLVAAAGTAEQAEVLSECLEDAADDFSVHIPGASFLGAHWLHLGVLRSSFGDLDGAVTRLHRAIERNDAVRAFVPSALCRWLLAGILECRDARGDLATATALRASALSVAPEFDPAGSPLVQAFERRRGEAPARTP